MASINLGNVNIGTELDITLLQNNDYQLSFEFLSGPFPFNLTGYTLSFYLKSNAAVSDGSGYTNTPTVVSSILGQITVTLAHAQLAGATLPASPLFYHIDGVLSGGVTTFVFGNVSVIAI